MLDDHEQILVNTFKNLNTYPYTETDLDYLINWARLFLIEYFHSLYNEQNQTIISDKKQIYFAALKQNVTLKNLPIVFHIHISFTPLMIIASKNFKFESNYDHKVWW